MGVTLVDLSADALIAAVAKLPSEMRDRVHTVVADVSLEQDVERYVSETVSKFGQLDVSAQVAGTTHAQTPVSELDVDTFERVMRVNVRGPFLGVKHSVKAMRASPNGGKGASIIICGSQLGLDGNPGLGAYCASKFAVRGLSLVTAAEVGAEGIRVNTVCPGPIVTPMLEKTPRDQWHLFAGKAMLGRLGEPEEVANTILYLASPQSSLITGATIKVDGGWSRWG